MIDRRVYVFWIAASFAALAWRPFVLGFYVDDWFFLLRPDLLTEAFSPERWDALELAQNRPVFRLFGFLLGSALPPSPFIWHLYVCAIVLATAIAIYHFCVSFLGLVFTPRTSTWAASIAGLFWLVFPWGVPINFWPTGTIALVSIIALCVSGIVIIQKWNTTSAWPYVTVFLTSLAGYLCYEAIYLQIFLIIAFAAWHHGWRNIQTLYWTSSAVIAQVAAIGFNRYMRHTGAEGTRAFNWDFIETYFHWFGYGVRNLNISWMTAPIVTAVIFLVLCLVLIALVKSTYNVSKQTRPLLLIGTVLFWAALLTSVIAVTMTLPMAFLETAAFSIPLIIALLFLSGLAWHKAQAHQRRFTLTALALGLAGLCLAALAYAAGEYVMWPTGIGGRVLIVVNVWIAFLIALGSATVITSGARVKLAKGLAIALWGSLLVGTAFRGAEWHDAWTIQQYARDNVPQIEISKLGERSLYLYMGPEQQGWVPAIETNMQIGSFAISTFWNQAQTDRDRNTLANWEHRWFVSRVEKLLVKWDGHTLTNASCDAPDEVIETLVGDRLWIWNGFDRTFLPAQPNFSVGC